MLCDLRKEKRYAVKLNALYCVTGTSGFKRARVENISEHGIYLRIEQEILAGTKLDVMFSSQEQSDGMLVCVEVLHHLRNGYGCRVISENTFENMIK